MSKARSFRFSPYLMDSLGGAAARSLCAGRRRLNEDFHDCLVNTFDYTSTVLSCRKPEAEPRPQTTLVEPLGIRCYKFA
jgi:hypothetical protein